MAELQKYFEIFHERIRADYDMDATLREKRDKILKRIRKYLAHERVPSFDPLLQGSYKLRTGVQPIGSIKFDIDVGLRFNLSSDDYTPSTVRGWILEAVEGHTDEIEDKGSVHPCHLCLRLPCRPRSIRKAG